jgi:hypothetical protein
MTIASNDPNEDVEPGGVDSSDDDFTEDEKEHVRQEAGRLRDWVKDLTGDDLKSGNWFEKLLMHALSVYTTTATWDWFQEKYHGAPADVIVDQRIKMAARYAAIEGGLSASAYSAAVVATIGSAGGASPLTLPAAAGTFVVDMAFTTQLQIRLAYDISVLYGVPIDINDPDDMWNLVRVAFTIKSGDVLTKGLLKAVPVVVRPAIKKIFSGGTLLALKSLPVVGKYLLQRNIIKIAIPFVGVPLAVGLNYWTTKVAGGHARVVFRDAARVIELADRLSERSTHPQLMLWVAWFVIQADRKIADSEALLIRHLLRAVRERHQVDDGELAGVIDIDEAELWRRVEAEEGDLSDVLDAARRVAEVDGKIAPSELAVLEELEKRSRRG